MTTLLCPIDVKCYECEILVSEYSFFEITNEGRLIPFYWKNNRTLGANKEVFNYEQDKQHVKVFCSPYCSLHHHMMEEIYDQKAEEIREEIDKKILEDILKGVIT